MPTERGAFHTYAWCGCADEFVGPRVLASGAEVSYWHKADDGNGYRLCVAALKRKVDTSQQSRGAEVDCVVALRAFIDHNRSNGLSANYLTLETAVGLEAYITALQSSRDAAERYAWIADPRNFCRVGYGSGGWGSPYRFSILVGDRMAYFDTLDALIDAARASR